MFGGIVQGCGKVLAIDSKGGDLRLRIDCGMQIPDSRIRPGESIAVNGVCLTVARPERGAFGCDVSLETLSCTNLGRLAVGDRVNLECALSVGDSLGGHLVSGHVDGLGTLHSVEEQLRSHRFCFTFSPELARYIVDRGSICVDGVSLTVTSTAAAQFCVNIIPHTLENTLFGEYRPGALANLEIDLVARYLESLLRDGRHNKS